MKILVVGDVMLDRYYWCDASRISSEAPVPILNLRDTTYQPGGAANVASNLVNLGIDTYLVGIIGDDDGGRKLRDVIEAKGIHAGLEVADDRPTIVKTRVMGSSQQIARIDIEVVKGLHPTLIDPLKAYVADIMPGVSAIIISDYAKGIFVASDLCSWLVNTGNTCNIPVFVDPKGIDWHGYKNATCITPNRKELIQVARAEGIATKDVVQMAHDIKTRFAFSSVLVTLGPEGMQLISASGEHKLTSNAREVYDVSGAGDTVIATLAAGYAQGYSLEESVRRANVAGGIVVGKVGTCPITRRELEEALDDQLGKADKFHTLDEALHKIAVWRAEGKRIVFTNGCFDLLHTGHIVLFREARKLGDKLIVAVNSDASVRQIKGPPRPILKDSERLQVLSGIEYIDMLLLFEESEPLALINSIRPEILAKGSDYALDQVVGKDAVLAYGGEVRLLPLLEDMSITKVLHRVSEAAD